MAWSYRKLVSRIATTAENHGIAVYAVPENGTSITFAYHGCEVARNPRGLIHCPYGRVMHSDVNVAWRGKLPTSFKTKTCIVPLGGMKLVKGE